MPKTPHDPGREVLRLLYDRGLRTSPPYHRARDLDDAVTSVTITTPDDDSFVGPPPTVLTDQQHALVRKWLSSSDLAFLRDSSRRGRWYVTMPLEVFLNVMVGRHEWGQELRRKHGIPVDLLDGQAPPGA